MRHTGKYLDISELPVFYFSKQKQFPFQTDGSSCSIYVCATARAFILWKKVLSGETNLPSFRKLMANEISSETSAFRAYTIR